MAGRLVEFLKTTEAAGQEVVGTVEWNGEKIAFEGLTAHFVEELEAGICGLEGVKYTPEDGLEFLKNLQFAYTGAYFRAGAPKKK